MFDYQKLAALFRKVKTLRLIQLLLCIAAVILAAFGATRILGFVLAGIAVVFYLFYSRRVTQGYCWEVLKGNIWCGICAGLPDVETVQKGSLSEDVFDGWKMLPRNTGKGGSILSLNGFSCTVKGKTLHVAETTSNYSVGGDQEKKSYNFLSGTSLWCEGSGEGDWLLLRREWIHPAALAEFLELHGYHTVPAGEKLDAEFMLCSREEAAVLPESLEQELQNLTESAKTLKALRISPEYNAAFLHNRFYSGKVHIVAMPTPKELTKNTLPERDVLFSFLCK